MRLTRAREIKGQITPPGDKSISHRAALIAALASGSSEISNFSTAQDCASTLRCLQQLGVSIEQSEGVVRFAGGEKLRAPQQPLDCGNSGSTMRILAGVLAGQNLTPLRPCARDCFRGDLGCRLAHEPAGHFYI